MDIRGLYHCVRDFETTTASDKGVMLLKSFTATSVVRLIAGGSLQASIVVGSMAATISLIEAIIRPIITSYVTEPYIKPTIIDIASGLIPDPETALLLQESIEDIFTIRVGCFLASFSVEKIQNVVLSSLVIIPQTYSRLFLFGVSCCIANIDVIVFGWKQERALLIIR
jgi:hypothetical protein